MKILIVGGGGREHAIAWKLAKSPKVEKMYCAPGNAGIAEMAECVNIGVMEFDKLVAFAKEHEIGLNRGSARMIRWQQALWMPLRQQDFVLLAQEPMRQFWKVPRHFLKT